MHRPHYFDPLGGRLPALESNIVRLRGMQMVLVLFYAEQLKQKVLDLVQTTDGLRVTMGIETVERVPKGSKDQVRKCLDALVADGAISADEKNEIKKLIDYRNVIGHDVHELMADMSSERYIRQMLDLAPDTFTGYDYDAVDRLRHYLELLGTRQISHHYIGTLRSDRMMFSSTERTLLADIGKFRARIAKLAKKRSERIDALNEQIKAEQNISDDEYPRHPLNHYDNKRLTKRGQEICYRLFDRGNSTMAVTQLMGISLDAARNRRRMWETAGGKNRVGIDLKGLPHRKFYRRHDD